EGALSSLRDALGFTDIQSGDAAFDETYCVHGSDAEMASRLLARPAVRAAIDTLFCARPTCCELDKEGTLFVELPRQSMSAAEARQALALARALGEALHAAASGT